MNQRSVYIWDYLETFFIKSFAHLWDLDMAVVEK